LTLDYNDTKVRGGARRGGEMYKEYINVITFELKINSAVIAS